MRLAWPYQGRGDLIAAAALACALGVALTTATLAASARDTTTLLEAGIAVRPPDVARVPWSKLPPPRPEQPASPRLVIERFDGETLVDVVPFEAEGAPNPEAFAAVALALGIHDRDVHPRLVELLLTLSLAFDEPLVLVSGYREPGYGTRKTSYHAAGMAADIAIRGVKMRDLRAAAVRLGATGVGLYPYYLHVDVREDEPYRWGGGYARRWRR